jgi:hypothetical protein
MWSASSGEPHSGRHVLCGSALVDRGLVPRLTVFIDLSIAFYCGEARLDARPEFLRLTGKLTFKRVEIAISEFCYGSTSLGCAGFLYHDSQRLGVVAVPTAA